jgi:hypothetical protein
MVRQVIINSLDFRHASIIRRTFGISVSRLFDNPLTMEVYIMVMLNNDITIMIII